MRNHKNRLFRFVAIGRISQIVVYRSPSVRIRRGDLRSPGRTRLHQPPLFRRIRNIVPYNIYCIYEKLPTLSDGERIAQENYLAFFLPMDSTSLVPQATVPRPQTAIRPYRASCHQGVTGTMVVEEEMPFMALEFATVYRIR